MKVIDLLNKIANNEEAPERIKLNNIVYDYYEDADEIRKLYRTKRYGLYWFDRDYFKLDTEIEIIEEKPKKIEEIKKRYDKQAITNYKQANFNSTDMKEICKTIGFLMQYLDEARDTINDLTKAVNYLLEKESDK